MIPIRDSRKADSVPYVCYLLIAINVAVFVHELSLGGEVDGFIIRFGLIPWNMTSGLSQNGFSVSANVVPWFSSMFIHGGWLHILGNMWFLYLFGDNVEGRLGKGRFLVLYLCGGLVAGLAQVISSPGEVTPMVGASGAVSALLGAYLVLYPRAKVLTLIPIFILFYFVNLPAFIFIGIWFLIQLLYGYASLGSTSGSVAWWAHIGGFVSGLFLVLLLKAGTTPRPARELSGGKVNIARGLKRKG